MKGGSKVKAILVIVILLLVGILTVVGVGAVKTYMSGAAGDKAPVNLVATSNPDCRGFNITFETATETQPMILYGNGPAALVLQKAANQKSTSHSIEIAPVMPGRIIYYKIKIEDEVFDNGGIPNTVTICNDAEAISPEETVTTAPTPVTTGGSTITATPSTVPTGTTDSSGCNKTTDYDGDGSLTTVDYYFCLRGVPTPTVKVLDDCFNVDFNKDGTTNTIDRIQCLNSKVQ